MKYKKRNTINKHHSSYDKATEYALQAIYDGVVIHFQGQEFSYDKQRNELTVKDFYRPASVYKPFFNAGLCDPFKELIRQEVINND